MDSGNRSKTRSLIKVEPILKDAIDISDYITSEFDYVIKSDLYNHNDESLVYDMVRQIALDKDNKIQRPMILISPDISISSATISGNAERHLTKSSITHDIRGARVDGMEFSTDLGVLYISSELGLCPDWYDDNVQYFQRSVMSNALNLTEKSFTNHNVALNPKNVFYVGVREDLIEQTEQAVLDSMVDKPTVFTLEDVRKKGIERIMKFIGNRLKNKKVHVVMDLAAASAKLAPSADRLRFRSENNMKLTENQIDTEPKTLEEFNDMYRGLERPEIMEIMKSVVTLKESNQLEGFDLTGYFLSVEEHRNKAHGANSITSKLMIDILKCISDFTEHSINIFDEESRFLIWKRVPTPQTTDDTPDDLLGWYILRNVDLDTRDRLISHFEEAKVNAENERDADNTDQSVHSDLIKLEYPIERFEFPNDNPDEDPLDVLISVTTPAEQNFKSHYCAQSYADRCLMPGEKVNMTFELLATPDVIKSLNAEEAMLKEDNASETEDDDLIDQDDNSEEQVGERIDEQIEDATFQEYNTLYRDYHNTLNNQMEQDLDHAESELKTELENSNNDRTASEKM